MNYYNGRYFNCFNSLVTDLAKLETFVEIPLTEPIAEMNFAWVDPEPFYYGTEGKQYTGMDLHFFEWNRKMLEYGLTPAQMKELNDISNTMKNKSHRSGWTSGEKHAKSMAVLYPVKVA